MSFQRDFTDRRNPVLLRDVTPGCEWVISGEGVATRKWDGTAVAIIGGKLYARYDAKRGKPLPPGAIPCGDPDPVTGHNPAWVLADGPGHKWIREAHAGHQYEDGTYEAIGPKIQGNPQNSAAHRLVRHGADVLDAPRSFDALADFLRNHHIEGIVFHHPDGRMCKIRRDDYGMPWPDHDGLIYTSRSVPKSTLVPPGFDPSSWPQDDNEFRQLLESKANRASEAGFG